jgi:hypothetical protein
MKKYYLLDIFWLLVLSALYLWPFFEKGSTFGTLIFLALFVGGLLSYLIFHLVLKFNRIVALFGTLVFIFSGLEIVPTFSPNQRLYIGIFPALLALLAFIGKKRKIFIIVSVAVLFSVIYILIRVSLFKVMVNFCLAILSMVGLDYFLNDKEQLFSKRYTSIRNLFGNAVMFFILVMFCFYARLIFIGGQKIVFFSIVNGFAWVTLFCILALAIIYLKNRSQRIDIILYILILTIIDIFTFWQKMFNL